MSTADWKTFCIAGCAWHLYLQTLGSQHLHMGHAPSKSLGKCEARSTSDGEAAAQLRGLAEREVARWEAEVAGSRDERDERDERHSAVVEG